MPRSKTVGNYAVEQKLGQGTYSTVKLGVHRITGEKVALKMVHQLGKSFDREVKIMQQLKHANIVQIKEVIPIAENNTSCIVMEYVEGGNLLNYVMEKGPLPEHLAAKFLRQILSALSFCHSKLVVHRDLKCENILLDATQRNVKLADFGLSRHMDPGRFLNSRCGSPHYMAPELFQQQYIGPEVDIFSMGVILYAMVSNCFPWDGEDLQEQLKHLQAGEYIPLPDVSLGCAHVIDRMLRADPKRRATISELLAHPWVNSGLTSSALLHQEVEKTFPVEVVDEEVLSQLEQLSFGRKEVEEKLKSPKDKHEFAVCLYFLLLEAKTAGSNTTLPTTKLPTPDCTPLLPSSPQVRRITRKKLQQKSNCITPKLPNTTQTRKLQERIETSLLELHVEFSMKHDVGSWKKKKAMVYSCRSKVIASHFELEIFVVDEESSQKAVVPRFLGGDSRIYNIILGHLNVSLV